jgi:pyroglutamyl-peptidase
MKRAILTGFRPFGDYRYNPVQDTAMEYNGKRIGDVEVVGLVLPCTYHGAFEVLSDKIDEIKRKHGKNPEIILGTGLASRLNCIRLETIGRNVMDGKYPDADGINPKGKPIDEGGRLLYQTNSDAIMLVGALRMEGIDSEVSDDAEGFICNSLIYLTARRIYEERLPIKFAFFHAPWTDDYLDRIILEAGKKTITKEELKKAIDILVREMGSGNSLTQ